MVISCFRRRSMTFHSCEIKPILFRFCYEEDVRWSMQWGFFTQYDRDALEQCDGITVQRDFGVT